MQEKTYCLINYGCQMNESDTEHYAGQLEELGYKPVSDYHGADVILVNTCCVRESAEKKIAGKIGELKAEKKRNPECVICVAGCMAQKDGEKLQKKHPQVDLLLGTAYVNDFKQLLLDYLADRKGIAYTDLTIHQSEFEGHRVRQSPFAAWIPIMYGCNNFCTYCIVPYVRGRERSRRPEDIIDEVRTVIEQGYSEVTLLGQNVNSYYYEGVTFPMLLRSVNEIEGLKRLRFMTSHPKDLSDELIDAMAQLDKVCKHIHLPVQSGSDEILRRMNRRYDSAHYLELVDKLRSRVKDVEITTDIIVGFPGETEKDFQDTCELVRRVGYSNAYTFAYSPRQGTVAARMEDQIPDDEKKRRLNALNAILADTIPANNAKYIGYEGEILVEGVDHRGEPLLFGKLSNFKMVYVQGDEALVGSIVPVQVDGYRFNSLFGHIVD